MKAAADTELLEISRKLSLQKRREWLNYGRTLSAAAKAKPAAAEAEGDMAWERIIAEPKPRPKLRADADKILAEMKSGKHFPPLRAEDL